MRRATFPLLNHGYNGWRRRRPAIILGCRSGTEEAQKWIRRVQLKLAAAGKAAARTYPRVVCRRLSRAAVLVLVIVGTGVIVKSVKSAHTTMAAGST